MEPRVPANETERLAALREYSILDTVPEPAYDDITKLASHMCVTPIALITLVDEDRQWFKSRVGIDVTETPREISFCAHAILETGLVEVPDASKDARFNDNPDVLDGPRFRFYAAAPLVTEDGFPLGTLCVMDHVPRQLTGPQRMALRALARQTMAQLELRRQLERMRAMTAQLEREHAESRARAARAAGYHAVLMDLTRLEAPDSEAALRTITRRDAEALEVSRVSVWMFDDECCVLECSDLYDARTGAHTSGQRLEAPNYPRYFEAMQRRRAIVANDARTDPGTSEFAGHYLEPNRITSMLDVPIWRDGRIVGIVCHEHTDTPRVWTSEEQDFAVSIADMVTLALEAHDRRYAEQALRDSEASYRAIFDLSNDAIYVHDVDTGAVVDVNRKACDEHGYSREELASLELGRLSAAAEGYTRERLLEHFRGAAAGEPQLFEWLEITRAGRRMWKEVSLRRVVINGVPRLLAAARDITQAKQSAEALRQAHDDLERRVVERTAELARVNAALHAAIREAELAREGAERANRAKSEFLSRMSHELRTPMNSILGFAQLLGRKDLPADQRKGVDHILKAGRHLLNLINEVLDIARIETDRQTFSLEPVDVSALLNETLSLIRPLAVQHDCRIEDIGDASPPAHVYADRQRLAQVLLNLLSNAVKYNRPGGQVRVTCEHAPEAGRPRVHIHVTDTGPGIAAHKLEQLFTPFERLGAEQSDVEGTGLGLALSKRLVEAMGGSVSVRSAVGEGSTFTVTMPLARSPLEKMERDGGIDGIGPPQAGDRSAKVLYIEDNLANMTLIETILAARPRVTLIPALQGRLGLDLAWEHAPDLILLDVHLPDMSGDELLTRLRADRRTATTPVLIISADAMPGSAERLLDRGAQAFLTKPLDVERFLTTVDRLLERTS